MRFGDGDPGRSLGSGKDVAECRSPDDGRYRSASQSRVPGNKRIASPNDSGNCFPERKRSTTGRNHRPLDVCGILFQTLSFYARPPSGFLFAAEYCESSVDSSVFFFCPSRGEAVLKLCGVFFPYCIFPMSGSCPASHERGGPAD